jgi:hypothetical protein
MAASDYTINSSGPLCPFGILAGAVGYSATTLILKDLSSTRPNDIVVGMAAMIDDEIVRIEEINLPSLTLTRGCADTVPAIHRAGALIWFFGLSLGTDSRAYVAGDTAAVKLLPYSTSGNNIPIEASPPNDITFNWRAVRPYPPAAVLCEGSAWYNEVKQMSLGADALVWTWNHRDRLLQADQLVGHNEADVGPEPGTTYGVKVYDPDGALLRTVTGIVGKTWTYTRLMAEADAFTAPEAFVELYSERDGFTSLQRYRTAIRVVGGNAAVIDMAELGWPGTKTNCVVLPTGYESDGQFTWDLLDIGWDETEATWYTEGATPTPLVNEATETWDTLDVEFDSTEETWQNTSLSGVISYEHPVTDLVDLGEYKFTLPYVAQGAVVAELSTSVDGITYTGWAAPVGGYVTTRFVKARFSVTDSQPVLVSAKISYFRRS